MLARDSTCQKRLRSTEKAGDVSFWELLEISYFSPPGGAGEAAATDGIIHFSFWTFHLAYRRQSTAVIDAFEERDGIAGCPIGRRGMTWPFGPFIILPFQADLYSPLTSKIQLLPESCCCCCSLTCSAYVVRIWFDFRGAVCTQPCVAQKGHLTGRVMRRDALTT